MVTGTINWNCFFREESCYKGQIEFAKRDATATGVESGRNVGFAGVTGDLEAGNNNNLA